MMKHRQAGGSVTMPTRSKRARNIRGKEAREWQSIEEAAAAQLPGSALERKFDTYWSAWGAPTGLPDPVGEFRFQRYKLDRAWPDLKVSVELNGGGKGHPVQCHACGSMVRAKKKDGSPGKVLYIPYPSHSGRGADRDARKANALQVAGWVAITFTSAQIDEDPEGCIQIVVKELKRAQIELSAAASHTALPIQSGQELTDRETQILAMAAMGMKGHAIGQALGISDKTIHNHMTHIRTKLDAPNATAAAARALAWGILTPEMIGL